MENRVAARVPVRVPARCRSEGVVIDGFVEDVSRTGLFLRTPELVAPGSAAEIALEISGEPTLYLNAQVVRVEHGPRRAGMGLRLLVDARVGRLLANFIMRQHATGAEQAKFPSRFDGLVA
jgi:PilZ domain